MFTKMNSVLISMLVMTFYASPMYLASKEAPYRLPCKQLEIQTDKQQPRASIDISM